MKKKLFSLLVILHCVWFLCPTVHAQYVLSETDRFDTETIDENTYVIPWAYEKCQKKLKISVADFTLICHTVFCESGNQSEEAQRLVALAILYRVLDDRFPNNVHDVIYQENGKQFNVVQKPGFPYAYPYTDTTEIAVYRAIAEFPNEPNNLLFFRSSYHFSWGKPYPHTDEHGDMYFTLK